MYRTNLNQVNHVVSDTPNEALITANSTTHWNGDYILFECTASGGRPSITEYVWYRNRIEVANRSSSQWVLGPLDYTKDDGDYACAGRNVVGEGNLSEAETVDVARE